MDKKNSRAAAATDVAPLTSSKPANPIDWQRVRIDAAIAAMQGILRNTAGAYVSVAASSVKYADALITELQEEAAK
jgi:hypothetical protein